MSTQKRAAVDCAAVTPASGSAPAAVGILGLGAYVPERVMTNAEWSLHVDTTDEWIRQRTGIERRRVAAPEQSTVDLLCRAARLALDDAGIGPAELERSSSPPTPPRSSSPTPRPSCSIASAP